MKNSASFDGIHRDAADQTAAKVFAGGAHYFNPVHVANAHWEIQPPLKLIPAGTVDLTGRKFGRFTVLGMHLTIKGRWVCRCSCGEFETRKGKSILNPENEGDRCTKCRRLSFEKRAYWWHKYGIQLDQRKI